MITFTSKQFARIPLKDDVKHYEKGRYYKIKGTQNVVVKFIGTEDQPSFLPFSFTIEERTEVDLNEKDI